ncbi:MAG: hypothetical protein ACYTFN_20925, partial [Planctomycetota bacterium]
MATPRPPRLAVLAAVCALFATAATSVALAQQPQGGQRVNREQMWWAPTAEDWKKPVLIEFQRTWKDAVTVARETSKPILICINMDGEIASEHYAGVRYRMPKIAKLYEPYVCVVVSVYRHNARDYDENGQRILCPRFGSVTCLEHMLIEPGIFEKFCDGSRVAPRHIMIELDGKETYDVYYTNDTDSVFAAVRKGIAERRKELTKQVRERAERTMIERVLSRDNRDRTSVETAYLKGDRATRRKLIDEALLNGKAEQIDLLRLAIFGLDVELNKLALQALAKSKSERAINLIHEALRAPIDAAGRDALIATLRRLGKSWPRARTLAAVHHGLTSKSDAVDVATWSQALKGTTKPTPVEWTALESRLEYQAAASRTRPDDPNQHLQLAEASLAYAVNPNSVWKQSNKHRIAARYGRLMLEDARRSAVKAEKLGASGWHVDAILGITAHYLGDAKEAQSHIEAAVKAMPKGEQGWNAMAVLGIFAELRIEAIWDALRNKKEWPGQWLTDVHAAYAVLARHPLGTDAQVVAHYDFLKRLGANDRALKVLEAGLVRFPDSGSLHDRLRGRILEKKGAAGLEAAYEARLKKKDAPKNLDWFAGYASIVAAEFHRRAGFRKEALAAYGRAITHFDHAIEKNPDTRATADHFAALALAGRARLAYERRDHERAATEILAAFARRPEAAGTVDGLNITPLQTARMLLARFKRLDRDKLAARIDTAIGKLPAIAFEPPAYERGVQNQGPGDGNTQGGQGGQG